MKAPIRPALESLLHGLISLGIGALLAGFILVSAGQQGRQGNPQLAAESLRLLWSPAIFAGVGALLIANGLVRGLGLLLRGVLQGVLQQRPAVRRFRARPAPVRPAQARASVPAAAPPDAYRRACAELGVEPGSDWAAVRATWRRNLPLWHPDKGGDAEVWSRKLAAYTLLEALHQFEGPP